MSFSFRRARARGFSTTELLISIVIMGVMLAAAIFQFRPAIQQFRANAAMDQVLSQLRWARQTSIAQRRGIEVQFIGNNEMKLIEENQPAGQTVLSDITFGTSVQFMLFPAMADTPDAFGNTGPVEFGGVVGGPPLMKFQSDGSFINAAGTPLNGTVFLGIPNFPTTARAITILGATGRVRAFRGNGTGWIE